MTDPFGHYIANALKKNEIGTSLVTYDDVYRTGIQLKNRVTDGSDPYAPYYRKGSAASHITVSEVDAIDLTDVELVHVTGIPPALSQSARKATFRLRTEQRRLEYLLHLIQISDRCCGKMRDDVYCAQPVGGEGRCSTSGNW